ncbi:DUF1223 domain-containing protein [Caenimonas terrae]|uniref:DUF1223 domain-containing protein n=1 Tax=Caenimonas terrae TaxID=696074 RepID=A0ABW0NIK5_9BURK
MNLPLRAFVAAALLAVGAAATAAGPACRAESAATLTPVIELYTSEGCSSCPPADRWLSTLKAGAAQGKAVVEAFHVGYWDSLGWIDRFAAPAHTARQKQIAVLNGLSAIYTPQLVRNGRDWPDATRRLDAAAEPAGARIAIQRNPSDAFEASVTPLDPAGRWSAYWTVTEHGHASKVRAGENAGEFLQHDFVVRQYVPAGDYQGAARLVLRAVPGEAGHPRQVNLVVYDKATGKPLQALSIGC